MRRAWMVGLWLAVGAFGIGCSGDSTTGDTGDDTDTVTDTDTGPECTGPNTGVGEERITKILCLEGDLAAGETFFVQQCALCHLYDGTGQDGGGTGANLTISTLDEAGVVATVVRGIPYTNMDAYDDFQNHDLANVTTYVMDAFIP